MLANGADLKWFAVCFTLGSAASAISIGSSPVNDLCPCPFYNRTKTLSYLLCGVGLFTHMGVNTFMMSEDVTLPIALLPIMGVWFSRDDNHWLAASLSQVGRFK